MNPDLKRVACIILAAGKGERMKSDLPKVLHKLAGKPLLGYVLETAQSLNLGSIRVIVGFQGEKVIDYLRNKKVKTIWQREQLGTGHAVMQAEPFFKGFAGDILILYGDVPLLRAKTLVNLLKTHQDKKAKATVITADLENPSGYGRIIRNKNGSLNAIVEDKDATSEEKEIKEINSGEICFDSASLFTSLKKIRANNLQKEYYLTDVLSILREEGEKVEVLKVQNPWETKGINSIEELTQMEEYLSNSKIELGVDK